MRAEEAALKYHMAPHEENGCFVERHYPDDGPARPTSGCIYYYLAPGESSSFHVIDCDEYWIWSAGQPLEVWTISQEGVLSKQMLGLGSGLEPAVLFRAGTIFGARHVGKVDDGTFVTCITVPRFRYEGWRLVPKDEVVSLCPKARDFYSDNTSVDGSGD